MIRRLPAILMLAIGVAGADPVVEPVPEQVTIPKATLIKLIEAYKEQRAVNILLWERQEEVNKRLDAYINGTGCT